MVLNTQSYGPLARVQEDQCRWSLLVAHAGPHVCEHDQFLSSDGLAVKWSLSGNDWASVLDLSLLSLEVAGRLPRRLLAEPL